MKAAKPCRGPRQMPPIISAAVRQRQRFLRLLLAREARKHRQASDDGLLERAPHARRRRRAITCYAASGEDNYRHISTIFNGRRRVGRIKMAHTLPSLRYLIFGARAPRPGFASGAIAALVTPSGCSGALILR